MKRENVYPNEMLDRVWSCSPTVELADADNYYTKGQVDRLISGITVSGVTEEQLNEAIASAKAEIEAEIPTGGTVSSAITSGDTNPVQGGVLYDELRLVTPSSEVELVFENGYATNLPNNCSAIKITVTENEKWGWVNLNNEIITVTYWDNTLTVQGYTGETYDISGNTVTIYLPSSFELNSVQKPDAGDPYYINVAAITPSVITPLINQVSANTTALGGLKLQQISQSDYENLPTKDSSTLYIII